MNKEVKIIIAEDDSGHAFLIKKNLKEAGLVNEILHYNDGEAVLDFFYGNAKANIKPQVQLESYSYIVLLDIRMPKVDGVEVLKKLKEDAKFKHIPVVIITTTDDPREVKNCHALGCNSYVTKPIEYDRFVSAIKQLGMFLQIVEVPKN